MNKALKILGFIVLFFLSIGTLFKLQHWPGGAFILTIGNMFLVIGFLPVLGIKRSKQSESNLEQVYNTTGIVSLIFIFLSSAFKANHWPGGSFILSIGIYLFAFVALPLFVFSKSKKPDKKISEIVGVVLIGVFVIFLLFLYSLAPSLSIIRTFEKLAVQQNKSTKTMKDFVDKYDVLLQSKYNDNEDFVELKTDIQSVILLIRNIKINLISAADGNYDVEEKLDHPEMILGKDNTSVPNYIMLGSTLGFNKNSKGLYLKNQLIQLEKSMVAFIESTNIADKKSLINEIKPYLSTDNIYQFGEVIPWEEAMFYDTPIVGTITILMGIEHDIRIAELILESALIEN